MLGKALAARAAFMTGCRQRAGASGFLAKDGPTDGLIDAIRRLGRGEQLFPRPQPEPP
ncbi:hypothetical protein GCM10009555_093940 [Acrocarpospora macrocephala]|uniref:Uncharacterized protein n=1 Tax=Acrocarpospora macrocephala TaxID=150177 RepID=A0A5M3WUA0_9ACTN|nr:response regulator transcription factor [Acrocarpospora macrocephala]GES11589.1 hypothetical protein Amac_051860 [Acrocarpospora macrocephala]